jgi:hypothetical protein
MRNLDDIIPPSRRREGEPFINNFDNVQSPRPNERSSRFPYGTLIAVVIVIGTSLGALYYFSSAKVDVAPNTASAAVQGSFIATQTTGDLPYEIISAKKIASQSIKSTGSKTVNSSASGTITIYNTQNKVQKLVANTRFATTAGLIFRIHGAVTIPAGTLAKPGSITTKVYADKVGDSYNIEPTSFNIPGFAGTPQESQVYGRSTTAFTGGVSGSVPVVDVIAEQQAQNALISALTSDLTASLQNQIPAGYILLSGAATTTFEELPPISSATTGMVDVREQGTITAVVFPNAPLAKAIAKSVSGLNYQGEPLTLLSATNIHLSASTFPELNAPSFSFTLTGTASLVYTVDPTRIAITVAGKTRSAAEVALTNYPEIKRAILILRPFWRKTFPQDPSTITVTVANP